MERRAFLAGTGAVLLAAPLAAEAQQAGKVYRIGLIGSGTPPPPPTDQGSLLSERLRELGWVYGRDFVVEQRAFGDRIERIPDLAAELIHTGVDIFVVEGATDAALVQRVTHTIPIVTLRAGDIVKAGLAASLARPGGNVTGIQTLQPELAAKQLSLLKEAIPRLSRSGVLFAGTYPAVLREVEAAGKTLGIALQVESIRGGDELERAFSAFQAKRAQAVVVVRSQYLATHMNTLVDLALKHRLPTISDTTALVFHGIAASLGAAYALANRPAEAIPLLRKVAEQAASMKLVSDHLLGAIPLGHVWLSTGRIEDAARLGRQALDLACKHKQRGHEVYALHLLGEVAARRDPSDVGEAVAHYRGALGLAHELGMRPLVAHCHLGLGKVYWRTGIREQAHEHLTTATTMYREMDMRFWLEQAEVEMGGLA